MHQLVPHGVDDGHGALALRHFPLVVVMHDVPFADGDGCGQVEHLLDVLVGQVRHPRLSLYARPRRMLERGDARIAGQLPWAGQTGEAPGHSDELGGDDMAESRDRGDDLGLPGKLQGVYNKLHGQAAAAIIFFTIPQAPLCL